MGNLSAFVERRWGSWGILVLALWALVLTMLAAVNMLLLTAVVENQGQDLSQGRIWTVFSLNAFFGLGFAASAYGLGSRRKWGRLLFMAMVLIWAASYVVALLMPRNLSSSPDYAFNELAFYTILYVVGAGISVWYLNLAHIKALFNPKE